MKLDRPGSPGPPRVRELLSEYGIRPRKNLSQNFLLKQKSLQRIIDAAELAQTDTVLEVGAGLGSLTYHLARVAGEVIAVETDRRLLPALHAVLAEFQNVRLIQADILKLDLEKTLERKPYIVVANIPYNLTSNLIRKFLEGIHRPQKMILTVQREVAERIIAEPGRMNLLALSVQVYGVPEIEARIPAEHFFPQPKVDSAVIRISLGNPSKIPSDRIPVFFRVARAGFQQKRKKLRNSLAAGLGLETSLVEGLLAEADIDPRARPQHLGIEEWIRLSALVGDLLVRRPAGHV